MITVTTILNASFIVMMIIVVIILGIIIIIPMKIASLTLPSLVSHNIIGNSRRFVLFAKATSRLGKL